MISAAAPSVHKSANAARSTRPVGVKSHSRPRAPVSLLPGDSGGPAQLHWLLASPVPASLLERAVDTAACTGLVLRSTAVGVGRREAQSKLASRGPARPAPTARRHPLSTRLSAPSYSRTGPWLVGPPGRTVAGADATSTAPCGGFRVSSATRLAARSRGRAGPVGSERSERPRWRKEVGAGSANGVGWFRALFKLAADHSPTEAAAQGAWRLHRGHVAGSGPSFSGDHAELGPRPAGGARGQEELRCRHSPLRRVSCYRERVAGSDGGGAPLPPAAHRHCSARSAPVDR